MKKAIKWFSLAVASAVCVTSVVALTACADDKPETVEYTVTYLDGDSVLKTEKVKEGEKAVRWEPSKDGYNFIDWYATPNFQFKFDFDASITENKSVFSQWESATQSQDTRTFYIAGSGTSPVLRASNWGSNTGDQHKMTKTEGRNEYKYTCDLNEGDKFQFEVSGTDQWQTQRGVGYLDTLTLPDGTVAFSGSSTIGDNSSYRLDIKCEYSGNYTFTLTTHPDDDTYETSHPSYTEANKEAFNINTLDKITWVRNGNASEVVDVITDYFIKGNLITNWQNMYNPATKMTNKDGVFTLEVYLKAEDKFMFSSQNTIGTEVSTGMEYIRASNLDDASRAYVGGDVGDMIAKASGTYTFTYTEATKVLSVKFDAEKVPAAADYYLDGSYGGGSWGDFMKAENMAAHKLTEKGADSGIYVLNNVELAANDELVLRAYPAGEETLTWENGAGNYNFAYLFGGGTNFVKPEGGTNIKVATAGIYNITFNSYSKMITIEAANANKDIYISGSMEGQTGWNPNYETKWKFTQTADKDVYELTVTLAADVQFGLRIFPEGAVKDDGQKHDWVGVAAGGTEGVTASFTSANAYNFQCTVAGTYKLSYNAKTGVLNIYQANA